MTGRRCSMKTIYYNGTVYTGGPTWPRLLLWRTGALSLPGRTPRPWLCAGPATPSPTWAGALSAAASTTAICTWWNTAICWGCPGWRTTPAAWPICWTVCGPFWPPIPAGGTPGWWAGAGTRTFSPTSTGCPTGTTWTTSRARYRSARCGPAATAWW